MGMKIGDRLQGVILSNNKIAFVVANFGGDVVRIYRSEMSPLQSDMVGMPIEAVVTENLDYLGKPILSNTEAYDRLQVASVYLLRNFKSLWHISRGVFVYLNFISPLFEECPGRSPKSPLKMGLLQMLSSHSWYQLAEARISRLFMLIGFFIVLKRGILLGPILSMV